MSTTNIGTVHQVVTAPRPRKRQEEVLPAPAPELVPVAAEPVLVAATA